MNADLETFTKLTKLTASATHADVVAKLNELVDHINALAPKLQGDEIDAPLEDVNP